MYRNIHQVLIKFKIFKNLHLKIKCNEVNVKKKTKPQQSMDCGPVYDRILGAVLVRKYCFNANGHCQGADQAKILPNRQVR